MKHYIFLLITLFFVVGCNTVGNDKLTVSVTIEPQRYFVEQIGGDNFKVNTIVPAGTSPETYDPTPSQMVALGKSSLYFMVGYLGFENAWGKTLAENNTGVIVLLFQKDISSLNHVPLALLENQF